MTLVACEWKHECDMLINHWVCAQVPSIVAMAAQAGEQ